MLMLSIFLNLHLLASPRVRLKKEYDLSWLPASALMSKSMASPTSEPPHRPDASMGISLGVRFGEPIPVLCFPSAGPFGKPKSIVCSTCGLSTMLAWRVAGEKGGRVQELLSVSSISHSTRGVCMCVCARLRTGAS
jgi:hypothetical protein